MVCCVLVIYSYTFNTIVYNSIVYVEPFVNTWVCIIVQNNKYIIYIILQHY